MFNLREYRTEPARLADLLLWAGLVAPGIVLNKDGSLQRTLGFRGPDLESSTEAELAVNATHLNNALKRFGSGWGLFIEARRDTSAGYPASRWPDAVSALIDEERRAAFEDLTAHYETRYFLTLTWMTPPQQLHKLERLLYEHVPGRADVTYKEAIVYFAEACERFRGLLADLMPQVQLLDDADTLTYLHSTVSTRPHRIAVPDIPFYLDVLLTDQGLTAGTRPKLGEAYLRTLSIRSFPNATHPGLLDRLNHLEIPFRYVVRYLPMDKTEAVRVLTSYQRKWFSRRKSLLTLVWEGITKSDSPMENTDALNKAQDVDGALQEVSADAVSFGYYTATVTVWDRNPEAAEEKLHLVERVINGLGFVTYAEDLNAVEAWLGSIPGNVYANVRRPVLSSLNLSHMMPASAVWAGPARDAYWDAPPLLVADTHGHTPFRYVMHEGEVGHTLILGPTGSGKTVLLGLMALQFRRYDNAQVYLFDKGLGLRAVTHSVGGDHYRVGDSAAPLAFQPLRALDTGEREMSWAAEWIEGLLVQQNLTLTPAHRAEIWRALLALAEAPAEQRTMTGLRHLVQYNDLREGLEPYTIQGAHGQLLDSEGDRVRLGAWQCFEMEPLFATPRMVAPVLSYLFHQLERRFTGAPTLLMLDEAWVYLDHPLFAGKIAEWLKVLRKANVSVVFATQSLADTSESSIAAVIHDSCFTRIFLPNARALEDKVAAYYRGYGLNDRQIRMLATAVPRRDYYFDSPSGNRLFTLELGDVARAICGAGSKEDLGLIDELAKTSHGTAFARALLASKGCVWAAELLQEAAGHGTDNRIEEAGDDQRETREDVVPIP